MKKAIIIMLALLSMSCTNEMEETYQYSSEDYAVMYEFVDNLHQSDLFDVASPSGKTYQELMLLSAPIVMSNTFSDTLGEGDFEKVYRLMFSYFSSEHPDARVTNYLDYILTNGLY